MSMTSRLASFVRNLVRRDRVEHDLDEELRAFVEQTAEEKQNAGLSPKEARRAALIDLGGMEQVKERVRDARSGSTIDQLRQDASFAVRMLRRNPVFAVIAVTTLALGVGATTAVFSVVDTVVFRRLPYQEPDRLVKICGTGPQDRSCDDDVSLEEFESLRDDSDTFQQIAADDGTGATIMRADGSRESVGVGLVSQNWLSTLGVRPLVGRDFAPAETQPGRDRVVILTHDYWRRRFKSDANVLGTALALDGAVHTVIGVLPPNVLRSYADVLKPLVMTGYADGSLDVFARLKPGLTLAQARAAVAIIGQRLDRQSPAGRSGRRLDVEPLDRYYAAVQRKAAQGLLLMLGAVGLVLLIACANVANLLLARATARRRESVIRSALGASRGRLVRQFLVETMLLFVLGGGLGICAARLSLDSLAALAVSGGYVPERMSVAIDLRVVGVSLVVALFTGLAFGLAPALEASRVDLAAGLRGAARALTGAPRGGRARRVLIVSELALLLVLLTGFGLLMRSFERVYTASGGFNPDHVLITGSDGGRSFPQAMVFWRAAIERARGTAGVTSVALTSRPPVHGARRQHIAIEGRPVASSDEAAQAGDVLISAEYLQTLGIPLLKGRAFTDADNERSRPVVIISESLARRHFPNEEPLGRRVRLLERSPMTCCSAPAAVEGVWREIVGVVGNVRQANLDEEPALTVYRPYSQIVEHDMYLLVRTGSSAQAAPVAANLQSRLTSLDPSREWWDVRAMAQVIRDSESIRLRRFVLILLGTFAAIALILGAVGMYGVASSAVAERTKEIGVRMALGATRPAIFRQMLGDMLVLATAGVALGSAGALTLTHLIRAMLFGISATDPMTYGAVAALLAAVVLLATYLPARRATQVDPMVALRDD
jgi:putative ABC transport system permease protein